MRDRDQSATNPVPGKPPSHLPCENVCVREHPAVVLISGITAAGKSTVADGPARQPSRTVHLRGDGRIG